MGELARRRVNAATALDPETNAPLYRSRSAGPASRTRCRPPRGSASTTRRRRRARPRRARTAADRRAARRDRGGRARRVESARGDARAATRAQAREAALEAEIEKVRASAARERELARAEAQRELADARAELEALRDDMREASARAERAPPAGRPCARRGVASAPRERGERALRASCEPLPVLTPLAPGDPVESPDVGVRGTIAVDQRRRRPRSSARAGTACGSRSRGCVRRAAATRRASPP